MRPPSGVQATMKTLFGLPFHSVVVSLVEATVGAYVVLSLKSYQYYVLM
jgi:hypothetical protein